MFENLCGNIDFSSPTRSSFFATSPEQLDRHVASSDSAPNSFSPRSHRCPHSPHLAIIADVRIDNREDLVRSLGEDFGPCPADDRHLLSAAYAKWGEQCGRFLLGDFAFAIWDEREKTLFCCRDHLGLRAFLYWHTGARFVFANRIERILCHPGVRRELNRDKLAAISVPGQHSVRSEETFHAGIYSLAPGSWMTVSDNCVREGKYWEPSIESLPEVPRDPAEAFETLRGILFQAVDCRIDRDFPAASLLSGGLDSSAIVSIAARCLEKQNRELTAIAAVLPDESRPRFSDERDYIDEFRAWPNVNIKYVTAPGRGPFDTLNDPSQFLVHPLLSPNVYLLNECEKTAVEHGARSLLWGAAGELGVTSPASCCYVDLAVSLRWPTLVRELRGRRAYRNVSSLRVLARQVRALLQPIRRHSPGVLFTPDFVRAQKPQQPVRVSRSPDLRQQQVSGIRAWMSWHALHRGQGLSALPLSQPLVDKRVLEFCLALPTEMKVRDGYNRYPVRGALEGLLPPRIQWRIDKTAFSPDYFARYNAQLGMAREFLSAIGPRDPVRSVLDLGRIETLLRTVDPTTKPIDAQGSIPCTLYAVTFLRQFSEFRP
jgi:asparagine synthase (glutamine-hydrolysing)